MALGRLHHHQSIRFWREQSPSAALLFFAAVFCIFGSIGFTGAAVDTGRFADGIASAAFSGSVAVVFALLGTRGHTRSILVLAAAFVVYGFWPRHPDPHTGRGWNTDAMAALISVVAGYVLMLRFIGTEGRRYYRLSGEMDLAGQIHQALAPPIARRLGPYEIAGVSRPSGQVGGDLLDVAETGQGWLAYLADVSGHGVAAGVLMGVVKSAVHTRLQARPGDDGLLPALNQAFEGLLPPEKYITFAAVFADAHDGLRFATAGHPPLFHYHAATGLVTEAAVENFPLGMFAGAEFASASIECAPGDILALYTDGMEEIFNPSGAEFGAAGLTAALRAAAHLPLPDAVAHCLAAAQPFGPAADDQTLLLIRRSR